MGLHNDYFLSKSIYYNSKGQFFCDALKYKNCTPLHTYLELSSIKQWDLFWSNAGKPSLSGLDLS